MTLPEDLRAYITSVVLDRPTGRHRIVGPRPLIGARGHPWQADSLTDVDDSPLWSDPGGASGRNHTPTAGPVASGWALCKAAATVFGAPLSIPAMAMASQRAQRTALHRIAVFPEHLHAVASGLPSPLPAPRVRRLSSDRRILVTSDLHRCIPGRLDWPGRQGTKSLYHRVLRRYAEDGWDLVENGDVEDFWMVGGSTWGAMYDVTRLLGGLAGTFADEPRRELVQIHLDRIVQNNAAIYELLREGFDADGRYHRTMGNHDDVFADARLVEHLRTHLPGAEVVDTIALTRPEALAQPDRGDSLGTDGVDAFVAHGHLTDAWNGPGLAFLGQATTWLATAFDDLPGLGGTIDGLPDEQALGRLLSGRGRNRLITVDPRFGGNRRFDSLDEERLFVELRRAAPPGEWPWLLFGHTHLPMIRPLDAAGREVRYANSGSGILGHSFTAIEWDPDERAPHLVVWIDDPDAARRIELVGDDGRLRALMGSTTGDGGS